MASQQPTRPFFRLGSMRPVQTTPQRAPPSTPAPQPSIVRAAVPRFRTPATQTTAQETSLGAPPRQIVPPGNPTPPAQSQAPLTNPATNSSPAPSPTATPFLRPPSTQPNLATSKPVSPQPRFMASSLPSSPSPKIEAVMRSSPQPRFMASSTPSSPSTKIEAMMRSSPQQGAATPPTVSSPRFPTDKSTIRAPTPQSPEAFQPQTITSVSSSSPRREYNASQNSIIRKPYPEPSTTPTITSPERKLSAPSPESKTELGSRSPPQFERLPTAVPASKVNDHGHTLTSSPKNGITTYKTPPQSPLVRPFSHPPSPLTLPPAQIKTEIYHEPHIVPKHHTTAMSPGRNGKPKAMPRISDTNEFVETTNKYGGQDVEGKYVSKKNVEAEQPGMRVIKLAGQNHGAIMELSPSRNKGNHNGWTNSWKTGMEYGKGNEEKSSNIKNGNSMAIQAPPVTAFMNSNVQGMNNSIVYNTSFNHNDPGVHFSFSKKPNGGYSRTT